MTGGSILSPFIKELKKKNILDNNYRVVTKARTITVAKFYYEPHQHVQKAPFEMKAVLRVNTSSISLFLGIIMRLLVYL